MKSLFKKKSMWGLFFLVLIYVSIVSVSCMSSPKNIGIVDGKLQPCPDSPNCVSSQSKSEDHKVLPLTYVGDAQSAKDRLKKAISHIPRMTVVTENDNYIHAEAVTLILRFVDDCEFLIDDENKVIHVRSASRLGHSDFGVNRKRVENIRKEFEAMK